jgi:hypothetical protein
MRSNAKELTNLIMSPLTSDKERQLKEIIDNKEQLDKIKSFWGESLTWECMQKLLNFDRKDKDMTKKWINDKVVNNYCKDYLAQQDETRCKQENGQKRSWFISSFFQYLFDEKNVNATLRGRNNYKTLLDGRRRHLGIIFSI